VPLKDGIPTTLEWLEFFRQRRDELTNPDHIAKMDTWIKHVAAEYVHDWDLTMATMTPDGVSRSWGGGPLFEMLGSSLTNHDRRTLYERVAKEEGHNAFKFVAMETERFFVGDDGIVVEGILWNVVPGDHVDAWGAEIPDGGDPNGTFAIGVRMALFLSFKDGLVVGEDHYLDSKQLVVELDGPVEGGPLPAWVKLTDD
jgi:hypothetical protein